MDAKISDIMAIAVSLLLFAVVIGFASNTAKAVKNVASRQQEEEDAVKRLSEYAQLAQFDDEFVSGAEVISCVRKYASGMSKDYKVILLNGVDPVTNLTWYVYAEDPEDPNYIQRKFPEYDAVSGVLLPLPTTEEFESFINPVARYKAHIVYDKNNAARKLVFAKEVPQE